MDCNELISNIEEYYDSYYEELSEESKVIEEYINNHLKDSGLIYRVFSRAKSKDSVIKKAKMKSEKYINENKKMQDSIGVRIVLYFSEDIDITISMLEDLFELDSIEYDRPDVDTFCPQRINIVLKKPDHIKRVDSGVSEKCLIDNTFEVQIRTIFSEGWHEVEHDFRYKYKSDWEDEKEMSRDLNGLFAVLEICDRNIVGVLDNVAYNKYKKQLWESMIRNRFRLRFDKKPLSENIAKTVKNDTNISKRIFRFPKNQLVGLFYRTGIPVTFDNVVFLINHYAIKDDGIYDIMSQDLLDSISDADLSFLCEDKDKNPYNNIVAMKYM